MATTKDIIDKSLRYIGQSTQFLTPNDNDYNVALDELNSMLKMWYKQGLRATFDISTLKLQNTFPYPEDTFNGIAFNLAVAMYPLFDSAGSPSAVIYERAKETKNEIWTIYGERAASVFPSTLPIGSGNEERNYGWFNPFYPDCDEPIYGCRKDTVETNGTPLKGVKHEQ